MSVQGYAIETPDGIQLKTLTDTERGAMVNFLMIFAAAFVSQAWSDELIQHRFDLVKGHFKAECVRVTVSKVPER
jgi:hypothetical protein